MSRKKWIVSQCDKDNAADIAEMCGLPAFAAFLLCSRGIDEPFAVDSFLFDDDILDPFLLPDMEQAVEAVNTAIELGKHITVFGDYDADGVTATVLLYSYLISRGANADYYVPDRAAEGYGMSMDSIKALKDNGTEFIITVDNGVNAVREAEYIKQLGMELVITDHHRPSEELPDALAVVDAHRCECDEFCDWAGVGVAFKLVCALEHGDSESILAEYGDIIAIGTVADIVPLRGENRLLVRRGVELLNSCTRPGLNALKNETGCGDVTAMTAAFTIAPRINAAGRMGSADRALELLLTQDGDRAAGLAREICAANAERRKTESDIAREVEACLKEHPEYLCDRVLVVDGEGWHQGVIGIAASRVAEKYGKPAIIISREGESAKGSGRSLPGFSLYDALGSVKDLLTQFGGHTLAAGLSMSSCDIPAFRKSINEYAAGFEPVFPELHLDCKLNPSSLNLSLLSQLSVLEPFGAENPQPLFGLYNMKITSVQSVGGGKHLRLGLARGDNQVTAMYFGHSEDTFAYRAGDYADVAVRLDENVYMGETKLSIQVRDIRPAGADDAVVLKCMRLYEKYAGGSPVTPDEAQLLLPGREVCAAVYKYLRSAGTARAGEEEMLCRRAELAEDKLASVMVALDALTELELINKDNNGVYSLPRGTVKKELDSSAILRTLREVSLHG